MTSSEKYFLYSYSHLEGFKMVSNGFLEGLENLISLQIGNENYVIALSSKSGSLLKVIRNGSR